MKKPIVEVSKRAVIGRINRKLKADMQMLRQARGWRAIQDLGEYYVIDFAKNWVADKDVDIEDFARKLDALKPWEKVDEN